MTEPTSLIYNLNDMHALGVTSLLTPPSGDRDMFSLTVNPNHFHLDRLFQLLQTSIKGSFGEVLRACAGSRRTRSWSIFEKAL